jgi:hypothetical protein
MQRLSKFFHLVAVLALAALVASCATSSAPPAADPRAEALLVSAGFKTVPASTDKQLQQLPTLPVGQVTVVTQTGKNWFIYPDFARNRVYVGTQKEYQAYLKLRAQNNLPDVDPEASYYKQDVAMTAKTARYAGIPFDGWPDFAVMSW